MHVLRLCEQIAKGREREFRLTPPRHLEDRLPPAARPHLLALRTPLDGRVTSLPAYAVAVLWRSIALIRRLPKARVAVASTTSCSDVVPAA